MGNGSVNNESSTTGDSKSPMELQAPVKAGIDGKAYQSIAQSTAIAVQDATDYLRNLSTISTTAVGVAMAQLLATGDTATYSQVITNANNLVSTGVTDFQNIGKSAMNILNNFSDKASSNTEV